MAEMTERRPLAASTRRERADTDHQAFRLLHIGFIVLPTIAGLDKFFMILADWHHYLAPPFANLFGGHTFMYIVGAIEIVAGLVVAVKPKFGGYLVAAWLAAIIGNLILLHFFVAERYWDIALRDFGLMLGALALARLATLRGREKTKGEALP